MKLIDKNSIVSEAKGFRLIPLAIILAAAVVSFGIIYKYKYIPHKIPIDNPGTADSAPRTGFIAPSFALKTSRGVEIKLEDLHGQNILLVFWSTQCTFSQQELPDLKKFTEEHRGQIAVIAIDYKEDYQTVKDYEEKEGINFPILLDVNGKIFEKYNVEGTPYHFLINKEGKIAAVWPNYANSITLQSLFDSVKKEN